MFGHCGLALNDIPAAQASPQDGSVSQGQIATVVALESADTQHTGMTRGFARMTACIPTLRHPLAQTVPAQDAATPAALAAKD